jgi:hypothetical protein
MLTRFAVLTAILFCVSGIARAQTDGATGGTGGTTQGGTTATTGSTTTSNTNSSLTNTPVGQGEGAVSSEIQAMTVESTRASGLQNLGGNTLQATSAAAPGGNTLPGGSQFGGQNRGNTQNRNTQRGGTSSSRSIRPSLRLGFVPFIRPSADVGRSVGRSFSRIASRTTQIAETKPELRNVRIEPGQAGLLTLTGSVPTAAVKRLAANLLRMEPGVRKVQNNLTVAEAPAAR